MSLTERFRDTSIQCEPPQLLYGCTSPRRPLWFMLVMQMQP